MQPSSSIRHLLALPRNSLSLRHSPLRARPEHERLLFNGDERGNSSQRSGRPVEAD